jgi:HD-GYP domain-containing protein (c-di-GMP phosphodiesterase class II)
MHLMATRRLEPGAVLARDVAVGAASERALLRAGVQITERYRDALIAAGHNAVYVEDAISEGVVATPALSAQTRAMATASLKQAFATVPAVAQASGRMPAAFIDDLERVARMIAAEVAASGDAVIAFSDLAAADAYTLQHSIDVCAIGLLIAKRLYEDRGRTDYRGRRVWSKIEESLAKLGVGLMLHDIGKVVIPSEVLDKPGRLTADEWKIVRTHPVVGLELLATDTISPLVKAVVRSHHERWDGQGYPFGTAGTDIPHFARIAAVADVFDAVTSERVYKAAAPQHVGHRIVNEGAGTHFDPEVVEIFNRVVAPYPPGDEIVLADGRRGVVLSCPTADLTLPRVRVAWDADGAPAEPEELDLLEHPDLAPGATELVVS